VGLQLHQLMFDRVQHQARPGADIESLENYVPVAVDGSGTEVQLISDLQWPP
jgi:hypothetical protein